MVDFAAEGSYGVNSSVLPLSNVIIVVDFQYESRTMPINIDLFIFISLLKPVHFILGIKYKTIRIIRRLIFCAIYFVRKTILDPKLLDRGCPLRTANVYAFLLQIIDDSNLIYKLFQMLRLPLGSW